MFLETKTSGLRSKDVLNVLMCFFLEGFVFSQLVYCVSVHVCVSLVTHHKKQWPPSKSV